MLFGRMGLKTRIRSLLSGPGLSFEGVLPPLSDRETILAVRLRKDVEKLAGEIGERNFLRYDRLIRAQEYIEQRFRSMGYSPEFESYPARGLEFTNLIVTPGRAPPDSEVVLIGAHYDSAVGCPAANDNGSGVAALLALAERFVGRETSKQLRFVAFTNEEPPFSFGPEMGSYVTAKRCKERQDRVAAMVSLETIAYFSNDPKSQAYPPPVGMLFPDRGNFIGFVSNLESRPLLKRALSVFRQHTAFPSEGAALPGVTPGVGWSDHWSFWRFGYPAIMVTDTAPFRYPHYHRPTDTPEKLDYEGLARVVTGLEHVIADLAS